MDKKKSVVLVGDSLTEFFDWQGRFPAYRIRNLGIAGEPVEGLLGRLPRIRSEVNDPDFVLVMTGINNIAMGDYGIIPRYKRVLKTLISDFPSSVIIVQSVLPVILPWLENEEIERINRELEKVAGDLGIGYLDVYGCFTDEKGNPVPEYLSDDGVHLSSRGYEVWSGEVEARI